MFVCSVCGWKTNKAVVMPLHCRCGSVYEDSGLIQIGGRDYSRPCIHLGEKTGDTIKCRTCGGRAGEVPVYRCAIEGTTLLRKPTPRAGQMPWDGAVCVTCELREDG